MRTLLASALCVLLTAALGAAEPFRCADPQSGLMSLAGVWRFQRDAAAHDGVGVAQGWQAPGFDDAAWKDLRVGESWETQGESYDGVAWYRQRVVVPEAWQGQALALCLGRPDDNGTVWWNGQEVFATKVFGPHIVVRLDPASIRYGAENSIAVRIVDRYKNGGLNFGVFSLGLAGRFAAGPATAAPEPLRLSVTRGLRDDILSDKRWTSGWRDGGTADTRPRLSAERGAWEGGDALAMEVWYPNSSGEFVDCALGANEDGDAWAARGDQFLSFMVRSDDTEGEFMVRLNTGEFRWGSKGVVSYFVRVDLVPGAWQRIILPFAAFQQGSDGKYTQLSTTAGIDHLSLGYRNHELRRPGTIRFADFRTGRFELPSALRPIPLDGAWRFRRDDRRADGSAIAREDEDAVQGVGRAQGWHQPEHDDAAWGVARVGLHWEDQGHRYDGPAWLRARVELPAAWQGRQIRLDLGRPDDRAEVWVNGVSVARIDKFGPAFRGIVIPPEALRFGAVNTIAVRVVDWYGNGGLIDGPFAIGPAVERLAVRTAGDPSSERDPAAFEMGALPGRPVEIVMRFAGALAADGLEADFRLKECFHRTIAAGTLPLVRGADGDWEAVIRLDAAANRRLFYGEIFALRGLVCSRGVPVAAFDWSGQRLRYAQRDVLALPPLPETWEDTPYGRLRLVDVIDCAADPALGPHPYKEGGIRDSWVGRRAYATWQDGISVKEHQGRRYREANNNEHFLYRIGRGDMKPHQAYVLRMLFPDNAKRYMPVEIKAGRNYNGTGFRSGAGPDDPRVNYPQTGEWQWMDNFVFNDTTTYGSEGARMASSRHGFWVAFHDIGRCYAPEYDVGPGVAELRLYEIPDPQAVYPQIRLPQGQPQRVLMHDWEREPEIRPFDMARHARLMGFNAVAPVFEKWGAAVYFPTKGGWNTPAPDAWNSATEGEGENSALYEQFLRATAAAGLPIIPRIEYGGSPTLAKEARVIGPDGAPDPCGRFFNFGANILHPAAWAEMEMLIDELVGAWIGAYPHIAGIHYRMRSDRIKVSYGIPDIALFCRETGTTPPTGDGKAQAKWASGKMGAVYNEWWRGKHRDFLVRIRDKLRSIRPDLQLYYYNWDPDGWNMGPTANGFNKPEDWSDYYNIDRARLYHERITAVQRALKDADYVRQLTSFAEPHWILRPELYAKIDGIHLFAPMHWRYLADNAPYLEYFRTGAGLAVCNMFNYEEKGRWNVHHDNYETSEMVPGGRDFAMAEEVLASFHADPHIFTLTTYTFGRAFVDVHRRFAQAFRALPAVPGTVRPEACADPAVRVRTYPGTDCAYVGIVHVGTAATRVALRLPFPAARRVVDLVTGADVPFTIVDGALRIDAFELGAMRLDSLRVE
ncbi:MAG: hypothetical protein J0M02_05955 [Planctomycetes bacterium]|nr:hypothetical protein [Planctomycetota bacterium]